MQQQPSDCLQRLETLLNNSAKDTARDLGVSVNTVLGVFLEHLLLLEAPKEVEEALPLNQEGEAILERMHENLLSALMAQDYIPYTRGETIALVAGILNRRMCD